jgi:dephospho-CoA kinase
MCGSGKSIVTNCFKAKGWQAIRFGEITIRELRRRNLRADEPNERAVREELRKSHGQDAYARMLLSEIEVALGRGPTVIDGLYSWAEYKFIRQNIENPIYVVAVFTPRSLRYERLARRAERPLSAQEAEARDVAEIENIEKGGPIAMADWVIVNDGAEEDVLSKVDRLLLTDIFKRGP